MNEPIAMKSGSDGRPLYLQGAHLFARTIYGLMLALYLVGLVGVVSTFVLHPLGWKEAAAFLGVLFFPLIVGTALRTWAIYGSARGLEIVRWGKRHTVPWSKVGTAEYAWWSFNWAARVAHLSITEEKGRTILFFANDRTLSELEGMRAIHAGR